MKIVFNHNFRLNRGMVELRYVRPNLRGSFPIISIAWSDNYVHFVIWPLIFSIGRIVRLKPTPLTEEEKKQFEELMRSENEDDSTDSKNNQKG